ncbi:MAG: DUF3472 domain-containing protein [Proteobacteria bacterium]|nr:DUF3472 domain-containing protein [Pseudomonadota bacterium]
MQHILTTWFVIIITPLVGMAMETSQSISIPTAGNTWVTNESGTRSRIITRQGIENWTNSKTNLRTYFRVEQAGQIDLALRAKVRSGESTLRCQFGEQSVTVTMGNTDYKVIPVGAFNIKTAGYAYLDLQGVDKSSDVYADVTDLVINGVATRSKVFYVKDDFYFGKRGPSVHLNYLKPDQAKDVLYFYNEVTIPQGQDVIGSFFMANGFGQGYFGMQVNSERERRILFSVWSPYRTNNPKEIPEDQRIQLLKKGDDVNAGKFGGEGSGGQSYRKYMWKADTTYRFLLKGQPLGNDSTEFTAYFYAPEIGKWELIARFRRPKTDTHLTRMHSFLENFITATGQFSRKGLYGNQWIYDTAGHWYELTQARFTADATARKENRLDYSGGVEGNRFFMKNCGFFNERSDIGTVFTRKPTEKSPDIDFSQLP